MNFRGSNEPSSDDRGRRGTGRGRGRGGRRWANERRTYNTGMSKWEIIFTDHTCEPVVKKR